MILYLKKKTQQTNWQIADNRSKNTEIKYGQRQALVHAIHKQDVRAKDKISQNPKIRPDEKAHRRTLIQRLVHQLCNQKLGELERVSWELESMVVLFVDRGAFWEVVFDIKIVYYFNTIIIVDQIKFIYRIHKKLFVRNRLYNCM